MRSSNNSRYSRLNIYFAKNATPISSGTHEQQVYPNVDIAKCFMEYKASKHGQGEQQKKTGKYILPVLFRCYYWLVHGWYAGHLIWFLADTYCCQLLLSAKISAFPFISDILIISVTKVQPRIRNPSS